MHKTVAEFLLIISVTQCLSLLMMIMLFEDIPEFHSSLNNSSPLAFVLDFH